ncbi:MAG: DUF3488 and transglutaminase-like domain-containing protein [Enterobacterales bacterium]|nr:DUF3488 and transglutaminase-like domain-containing protein [Enterobacterales bacterium]
MKNIFSSQTAGKSNKAVYETSAQGDIKLLPIIIAQQLVLLPLYFFIPLWVVAFNLSLALLVYKSSINKTLVIPNYLKWFITLVALAGILYTFQRVTGRDAGVAFITVMYGLKIIEIKRIRDVYVLMILGFFMLLAGFLFEQSPAIAIYQVIPVTAILYALTSIHLIPSIALDEKLKQNFEPQAGIKKLLTYVAYALPLMAILFVFFPRMSGPIWKMLGQSQGVSGISETMSPGAISSLQLFETVAFRVKFDGKAPSEEQMYWRTLTLDHFDGFTWSRSKSQSAKRLHQNDVQQTGETNSATYKYDISLERTRQKWLTFLDRPHRWPDRSVLFGDFSIQTDHRILKRTRYHGVSEVGKRVGLQLSAKERASFIALPTDSNQRSLRWAKQQRQLFKNDQDYIFGLLRKIHNQEFYYTLTPPIMERNTVDSFWFDHQKGFCEHYAGSLVFMARAANIPARVVIGYQGGDANPVADYWIVRYANAHAWTEIWFEGRGWIRLDPTAAIAASRVEEQLRMDYSQRQGLFGDFGFESIDLDDLGWIKHMQYWIDELNTGWNDWILDYNRDSQQSLFKSLGLDQFKQSQISLMMIFAVGLILSFISYRWMHNKKRLLPMEKSFALLLSKTNKWQLSFHNNEGISQLIVRVKEIPKSKIDDQTQKQLIELLLEYECLSYSQTKLSNEQQKSFHKKVKQFKI